MSKSVQRLEERLGVRLFSRTTRSLSLTAEGRDLYERALRLLREAEELEQVALSARAEPAGVLKVTAPLPVGVHLIAPYLQTFRDRYPSVSVDLRLGDSIADLIEEGIDITVRVGWAGDSRIIGRKLVPNRVCAFASPGYLDRHGVPQRPDDLHNHECVNVRFKSSGQTLRWPFRIGNRLIEVAPNANIVVDDSDAVAIIVAGGGGIGISPTYVAAPFVERGELIPILRDYWAEPTDISMYWPESRRGNPTVKAFAAFLAEIIPNPAPWNQAIFGE